MDFIFGQWLTVAGFEAKSGYVNSANGWIEWRKKGEREVRRLLQ